MINHPLTINTFIIAEKPKCACSGGGKITVSGKILKVINNHSGIWYYLDSNTTVKSDWVKQIRN